MKTNIGWAEAVNLEKIRWIDRWVALKKSAKVLDLGSGAGWYSKYLADKGCSVVSLDQGPLFEDSRIDIKLVDLELKLQFADQRFDYVIAWDIIEHVANDMQLLSEIYRVSKKGAYVLVSVPHGDDSRIAGSYLTYCHFKDKTHKREYSPESLKSDFTANGFKALKIELLGGCYPYILLDFIDNRIFKIFMRIQIKLMMLANVIDVGNCHGDIFGVFRK